MTLDPARIRDVDTKGMLAHVLELWRQIPETAAPDGHLAPLAGFPLRHLVVGGLGGSAIGGDLLRGVLSGDRPFAPLVTVVRDYHLPRLERDGTLVLVCSYSGETEETLSLYEDAASQGLRRAVVTSGGTLAKRAQSDGLPLRIVPGGLAPRAAAGYLLSAMIEIVSTASGRADLVGAFDETRRVLRAIAERSAPDAADNPALRLAESVSGRLLVIVAARDPLEGVAFRWKTQWNENAKSYAYPVTAPEMSHNEIVAWDGPVLERPPLAFALLRDPGETPRTAARLDWIRERLVATGEPLHEFRSEGLSPLARILSLVLTGDLASTYLAITRGVDPTPIASIDRLKRTLGGGTA